MLFSAPVIQREPSRCLYSFLFLPLNSQAAWVVSLSLKNDEFTTNNPQVGVN